jgi:Flp pilus assembly protein TadG
MIGTGPMERRMLKIFLRGNASPAKLEAYAQCASEGQWARPWRGAPVRLIDDRSGSIVPMVAIMLTVLLGLAALGTEVGTWYGTKRNMQGAADSAAYSAAIAKNVPPGTSAIFTAQAKSIAGNYGYVDASNNVTVSVNNPPKSGNYSTNNFAIEVTIQQPQQALLSATFMKTAPTLAARAVALLTTSSKCVYALNPKVSGSFYVDGGTVYSACGVVVNSSSTSALTNKGTLSAPSVDIVGGYSGTINSSKITTGIKPVSDPLFYVPAPTYSSGSCDYINYSISSGTVTLSKGVYCGGITISGNAAVTLNSGTYILMGGGLTVSGSATLSGTGVTLYNTGNTLYPYKPIQTLDNSIVTLTAPTSGVLAGILFFQDRSIVSAAPNILAGSFTGVLYFPTTPLVLNSGSDVTVPYTILVADTVSMSINTLNIKNDYSSLAGGSPIKEAKLIE